MKMTDILMMMFSMWALGTGTALAENSSFGFSNLEFRTEADIRKELHGFKLQTELLEKYALINNSNRFSFFPKIKSKYKAYLLYRAGWGENEQPSYIKILKRLKEKNIIWKI